MKHKKFIIYCFFGTLGGSLEISIFNLLYETVHLNDIISNILAFTLSVIFCFFANNNYVYKTKSKSFKLFILFVLTRIAGLVFDTTLLHILIDYIYLSPLLSKIISCSSSTIINYYVGKKVFK